MRHPLLRLFPLLILLLVSHFQLKASHVLGTDITWKCLDTTRYLITVEYYRDCNGCDVLVPNKCGWGACGYGNITVSSACTTRSVSLKYVSHEDVTPVCDSQCTQCSQCTGCSFSYGIQKYVLQATVNFNTEVKNGCCLITVSLDHCCRSSGLVNGGADENYYGYAELNACIKDNSPVYDRDLVQIVPVGLDFSFNFKGTDPDVDSNGNNIDSLIYVLGDPLVSQGTKMKWKSGYSGKTPVYFLGFPKAYLTHPRGFHLDSFTGVLTFRPMKIETSIIVVEVLMYRNGTYIGRSRREFDFAVIKTKGYNPPVISKANCKKYGSDIINACVNKKLCFTICTDDLDVKDSVKLTWDKGIRNGSFTITNPGDSFEKAEFCWTPTNRDVFNPHHYFNTSAQDNHCPIIGNSAKSFHIYVFPDPKRSVKTAIQSCGKVDFYAHSPTKDSTLYTWIIDGKTFTIKSDSTDTFSYQFRTPGYKTVKTYVISGGGCGDTIINSFTIPDFEYSQTSFDTTICPSASIQLKVKTINPDGKAKYLWSNGDTSRITNFTLNYKDSFATIQRIGLACSAIDTIRIHTYPVPEFSLGPDIDQCHSNTLYPLEPIITKPTTHSDTIYTYKWFKGSFANFISDSTAIQLDSNDNYILLLTNQMGCTTADTAAYSMEPQVVANFTFLNACVNDTVRFTNTSKGATNYAWYFADGSKSTEENPEKVYTKTGKTPVVLVANNDLGCTHDTLIYVTLKTTPNSAFKLPSGSPCNLEELVFINQTTGSGNSYKWDFGDGTTSTDIDGKHQFATPGTKTIKLIATSSIGCSAVKTQKITLLENSVISFSPTVGCTDEPLKFINTTTSALSINAYSWDFDDGNTATVKSPTNTFIKDRIYNVSLTTTNSYKCVNTLVKKVTIGKKSKLSIALDDHCLIDPTIIHDSIKNQIDSSFTSVWQTGDGTILKDTLHDYYYNMPGLYTIKWLAYQILECVDSTTTLVDVYPNPDATFSYSYVKTDLVNFSTANGLKRYHWEFGDGDTSNVAAPMHEYKTEGDFQVILTLYDANGCFDTDTQYISATPSTGIIENKLFNISVFPNPFSDQTILRYGLLGSSSVRLEIMDVLGQTIAIINPGIQAQGNYEMVIDKSMVHASGTYFLKLTADDRMEMLKVNCW